MQLGHKTWGLKDRTVLGFHGGLEVSGREDDIYTKCMQYCCSIHDICGRQWHFILARARNNYRVVAL